VLLEHIQLVDQLLAQYVLLDVLVVQVLQLVHYA
jgi:hypothetical protein